LKLCNGQLGREERFESLARILYGVIEGFDEFLSERRIIRLVEEAIRTNSNISEDLASCSIPRLRQPQ